MLYLLVGFHIYFLSPLLQYNPLKEQFVVLFGETQENTFGRLRGWGPHCDNQEKAKG